MKKILFIASIEEKYYYKPFIDECKKKNLDVHIFDPNLIPQHAQIYLFFNSYKNRVEGFIDTLQFQDESFKKSKIEISEIEVAWYIRERPQKNLSMEKKVSNRFSKNESRTAVKSLLTTLECKWVNKKETIDFLSNNKFYQQIMAKKCNLPVPKTIISNSFENISSFAIFHRGLLLKPMGYIRLDKKGKYFLYSQFFSEKEINRSEKAIRSCPIFAQNYIPKKCEYRVMVIGNRVLSCLIDSQASDKTKIDWRHYDFKNVKHKKKELPLEIQKKLLCFMDAIGLKYGAIDLIQTPKNEFVFLEINPSGQWGWIHELGKIPIPKAVAEMLTEI